MTELDLPNGVAPSDMRLRPKQLCTLLGIHPVTLYRWIGQGKLPRPAKMSATHSSWSVGEIRAAIEKMRSPGPAQVKEAA